jgi:hypothetical protein
LIKKKLSYYQKHKKELREKRLLRKWRNSLTDSEKILFDQLNEEERLKIIYGSRSILWKGHYIPDLPLELANKEGEPLSESFFSEKGKANLHRIKSGFCSETCQGSE